MPESVSAAVFFNANIVMNGASLSQDLPAALLDLA